MIHIIPFLRDEDLIGHSEPGNQSSTSQSKPHSKKPKAKQVNLNNLFFLLCFEILHESAFLPRLGFS